MGKLSIITLTFDNFSELHSTFESIQSLGAIFQWVVIDGGPCQKTAKFIKSLNNLDITYIKEKDDGIYDGFNKGLEKATGDYILYLNSGDILLDQKYFLKAIKYLDENPYIGFCHSNIIFHDIDAGKICLKYKKRPLGNGMPFFHQTLICRKAIFEKIGSFKISYKISADYDWVSRMLIAGYQGHFFNEETVLMDGKGVSASKEALSIYECYQSLRENQSLGLINTAFLLKRYCFYLLRKFLKLTGLTKILILIKKLKNP